MEILYLVNFLFVLQSANINFVFVFLELRSFFEKKHENYFR